MNDIDKYQKFCEWSGLKFKYLKEGKLNDLIFYTLGLNGESGELTDKLKKILRDKDCNLTEAEKNELLLELGDILWYIAQIATSLGVKLSDVLEENVEKINGRIKRGTLKGSGDNR